jgi:DNA-directed RNA polymerase specialized sigma24 family protein
MSSSPTSRRPSRFRARSEAELYAMDELGLIRYVADAKSDGNRDQAELGVHMLLYKHERRMRRRVALRLPERLVHHADTVSEWVLERVMRSALRLEFEGSSVGEWVNWWGRAIDRQVISFWRTTQGQALERQDPLPSEHVGEDHGVPDRLGEELEIERLLAQTCYAEIVQTVLERMANRLHLDVVRAAFWDDLPSGEVAERCGTTAGNVDQIKTRFRRDVRDECIRRGVSAE